MTMKKKFIPPLLTLVVWAAMYYYYLPPLNIHSQESWLFFVVMVAVALVINFWAIAKTLLFHRPANWESSKKLRRLWILPVALC